MSTILQFNCCKILQRAYLMKKEERIKSKQIDERTNYRLRLEQFVLVNYLLNWPKEKTY